MPPRWERVSNGYLHLNTQGPAVDLRGDRVSVCFATTDHADRVESDMRDVVDLVAWLRRGGR